MNAVSIGPLAFDGARLAAIAAILLFLTTVEITARVQGRPAAHAARWAGYALLAWIIGARIGFVLGNWDDFATHPLDALKLWQGGFAPRAGWAAGVAVFLIALLRGRTSVLKPLVFGATLAGMTHLAIGIALPRPAVTMPAMDLLTMNGGTEQLAGRNKPVVLNLWATWCPPCRREMPMMVELAAASPDVDFIFANQGESQQQVLTFLMAEELPVDGMLRDPRQRLMGELRAVGLPSTLVFDADGELIAAQTGEVSRASLNDMIQKALKELR
ncbi:TlpA family protein disulfide reductase [Paracoccus sp. TK19116]|uniref:TlpA family protein disulfide reductase n=1 Tax=Paracoccus albicereus TaxID=2922394 RepID=A0ABT1MUZ2_9RHOB|nr:TlpA disulfide reductase family protein [Paracoccus albicereus]MCQ0971949.1 TlpA family protein disulfide reductase [Paracoccus albicereus]